MQPKRPPDEKDERVPLLSVSKRWRKYFLSLFNLGVIVVLGFATWHEIWIKDGDSAWETALAIAQSTAICLVPLAVVIGVTLDVTATCRTTLRNVKELIVMLNELLKDALKRHRERKAEEERREEEVASLKQQIEKDAKEKTILKQRIEELEEERNGGPPRL